MKKNLYVLFAMLIANIFYAQTDLVKWALTSNGNASYTDTRLNATSITYTDNPVSYDGQGMVIRGWNESNIQHYRYFGFSVIPNSGNTVKISNLAFEQERLNPGPENYTIRYYISQNGTEVDDWNFLYGVGSTVLVSNESIANNPVKNIPLNITLSGSQRLIIKFYTTGNNWNAGWRIKANTLKLTEAQAVVPVANNDSYSVYKNTSNSLNVLSNDTSGSTISEIRITQQPSHGTLTVNGTTNVTYVPTTGYEGTDAFKYQARNATGWSNEATVSINVIQDPNTAVPVANNDSYTANKNNESNFNVLSNDTSVLAITSITITQQPVHGTLTVNGSTNVTYKPTAGYTGTDSFKYRANNSSGASNEATVAINVVENLASALVRWDKTYAEPNIYSDKITANKASSTLSLNSGDYWENGVNMKMFQINNWPSSLTVDTSKYVQFTISPKTGYKLTLSDFNLLMRMGGNSSKIRIDYSLNSSFTNSSVILQETTLGSSWTTFSLTNFPKPIATEGQTVYLRIYVYSTYNELQIKFYPNNNIGPTFNGYVEYNSTAPVAYNDSATTQVNDDIDINVLLNDDYSNTLGHLTLDSQPSHGIATINANNTINYLPSEDYVGADAFTYHITNQYGVSASATVAVNVIANNSTTLIRWDRDDYFGTPSKTFVESSKMTATGVTLNRDVWSTPVYVITNMENSNTLNTSKYIQFELGNNSTDKVIEPKVFKFKSSGEVGYEIRYSKSSNFSSGVTVLSSGVFNSAETDYSFNFNSSLKLFASEKLYVRVYLYKSYSNFVIPYYPLASGPEIQGLTYNTVYASNDTTWEPLWSNGLPDATKSAIINAPYDTATNGNFESQNLTINTGGSLSINAEGFVKVNGQIINNAGKENFVVKNDASLLQNSNSQNIGHITVQKSALLPKMGYNYWSSPVIGQNLYQFSNGYNQSVTTAYNPNGTPWNRFYVYNEANDYFVTSIANDITLNSSSVFQPARGYAIRGKNNFPETVTVTSPYSQFEFVGIPQNGDVSTYNLKWTNAEHGYNMVGNPYPSNISFDDFFAENNTKVYGIGYFWTNNDGQIISQQSSNYSGNNYAIATTLGGTSATYYGSNNGKPNGNISVGQGFIIQAKPEGKNQPLVFKNSMRRSENANYYNKTTAQKNRFWLEFKSPKDINNEILVGYIANATAAYDSDYDADQLAIGNDSFWSIVDAHKLAIQAKGPNFSKEDNIRLGFKASISGNFTISLTEKDGIFNANQTVYLKDKYLSKTVDITTQPYVFFSNSGQYEDRFEVVYKPSETTLGTGDSVKKGIQIYKDTQNFIVKSDENLEEVSLYDSVGRLLFNTKNVKKEVLINKTTLAEGMYIIQVNSRNTTMTKKVLK